VIILIENEIMIGFEITINNSFPISIASRTVQLFFTVNDQNVVILSSGIDEQECRLKWKKQILGKGDKINIKIKNLDMITPPVTIEKANLENIKERYFSLKTELEIKGLI